MNFIGLATGGHFAFAADHGHAGGVPVLIHVDAKGSGFFDRESQIRRIHFVDIALAQFADTEINAAFRKAHLRDALVQVQEGERGHAAKMDGSGAGL